MARFFIDHNLGLPLARAMRELGEQVEHVEEKFGEKVPDVDWLPYVGTEGLLALSRDVNVRRNPEEVALIRQHRVKLFLVGGKELNRCQIIQSVVRHWSRMKELGKKERGPFIYRLKPFGGSIVKVDIATGKEI